MDNNSLNPTPPPSQNSSPEPSSNNPSTPPTPNHQQSAPSNAPTHNSNSFSPQSHSAPVQNSNPAAPQSPTTTTSVATGKINYFTFILHSIIKPLSTFEVQLDHFKLFKNSAIIILITLGLGIISTIIPILVLNGKYISYMTFENWMQIIGNCLLLYTIEVFTISGVYFGVSQLFKQKHVNFLKLVTITCIAFIPTIIISLIGTLLSKLNVTVGMITIMFTLLYSIIIFYEGVNSEIKLIGNRKVYYNILCVVLLFVALFVLGKILSQNLSGAGLFQLFNMFSI